MKKLLSNGLKLNNLGRAECLLLSLFGQRLRVNEQVHRPFLFLTVDQYLC